jgi:hypothetical protein
MVLQQPVPKGEVLQGSKYIAEWDTAQPVLNHFQHREIKYGH